MTTGFIQIEIEARNEFWRNAVFVEWTHQYPDRVLQELPDGRYLAAADWLPDLTRVAAACFSVVRQSPADPGRRQIFRYLFSSRGRT
jgi:hypothetical protein